MSTEPKKFPSQDPALIKARREIKQIEESLHREVKRVKELEVENEKLKKENEKLKGELLALRQPPEWAKANKSEESKQESKKAGAKKGHVCHPRKKPEQVDREVRLIGKQCPHCDHELPFPHKWHEHVQIDVPPPPRVIVTRYHVGWSWCSVCKKEVSSKEKLSGSLYGPHLHSQVCYWKFSLGLTFNKIEKLLKEQYELEVSRGELSGLVSRSANSFNGAYEDLKTSLLDEDHVHADETGWRVCGENHWMWSFSNKERSYYHLDKSRSQKVVEAVLGKSYRGILISDFYGGYNQIECTKQKCWVHLLREVHELKEKQPKQKEIGVYLRRLKRFYSRGVKLKESYESGKEVGKPLKRLQNDTSRFAHQKRSHPDLNRLSKRIIKYQSELYVFIKAGIDPTNNAAEREIRPAVLMRKTSYGNRSSKGGKNQAILMSMIRTAHKQGKDFIQLATQSLIHH
jgi:transposase